MVDTTRADDNTPGEAVPESEFPDVAAAAQPIPASAPRRPQRGLVLAGAIVGAVLVLGSTFGGGILVGTLTGGHGGLPGIWHEHRQGFGPQGRMPGFGEWGKDGGRQNGPGQNGPSQNRPGQNGPGQGSTTG